VCTYQCCNDLVSLALNSSLCFCRAQSTFGVTHFGHFVLFHLLHSIMATTARETGKLMDGHSASFDVCQRLPLQIDAGADAWLEKLSSRIAGADAHKVPSRLVVVSSESHRHPRRGRVMVDSLFGWRDLTTEVPTFSCHSVRIRFQFASVASCFMLCAERDPGSLLTCSLRLRRRLRLEARTSCTAKPSWRMSSSSLKSRAGVLLAASAV
jgi:hypothetical protein